MPIKVSGIDREVLSGISSAAVIVSTTATALRSATDHQGAVAIKNRSAKTIYIGDSSVSVGDGFDLEPGDSIVLFFAKGVQIYAIVETATAEIRILEGK